MKFSLQKIVLTSYVFTQILSRFHLHISRQKYFALYWGKNQQSMGRCAVRRDITGILLKMVLNTIEKKTFCLNKQDVSQCIYELIINVPYVNYVKQYVKRVTYVTYRYVHMSRKFIVKIIYSNS